MAKTQSTKNSEMSEFEKDLLESIRQAKRGEGRVTKVAVTAATEARDPVTGLPIAGVVVVPATTAVPNKLNNFANRFSTEPELYATYIKKFETRLPSLAVPPALATDQKSYAAWIKDPNTEKTRKALAKAMWKLMDDADKDSFKLTGITPAAATATTQLQADDADLGFDDIGAE